MSSGKRLHDVDWVLLDDSPDKDTPFERVVRQGRADELRLAEFPNAYFSTVTASQRARGHLRRRPVPSSDRPYVPAGWTLGDVLARKERLRRGQR